MAGDAKGVVVIDIPGTFPHGQVYQVATKVSTAEFKAVVLFMTSNAAAQLFFSIHLHHTFSFFARTPAILSCTAGTKKRSIGEILHHINRNQGQIQD